MRSLRLMAAGVSVALTACAAPPTEPPPGTGTAEPEAPAISIFGGVYSMAQAERGRAAYASECAECHQEDLAGKEMAPGLVGVAFSFRWRNQTLNDLYASLRLTMPQAAPGSLTDQAYVDLVAFMLQANGYPAGGSELPADPQRLAAVVVERAP